MALNINKREGDKLHAEEWNELVQEVQGKQPRLNIVDALDSTSSADVLSAKQGKILNDKINSTLTDVETISEKVNKLPTGYYYGQFDSVNSLPDASQLTQRGYAYIASEDTSVYYIYLFDGEGSSWEYSGNKFVTTELESDLETKSQTKAPTTKAVKEGIEASDITLSRNTEEENELTPEQKYNASANINDREAIIDSTQVIKYGYKIVEKNVNIPITAQINRESIDNNNIIYEIKDDFDLNNGTLYVPEKCVLRFNGGTIRNGTISGIYNTIIEAPNIQIFYNIKFAGTFSGPLNACWVGARSGDSSYDNSTILKDWFGDNGTTYSGSNGWCNVWKTLLFPRGNYYFLSSVKTGNASDLDSRFLNLDLDNSKFSIKISENPESNIATNPVFLHIRCENFTMRNGFINNANAGNDTDSITRVSAIKLEAASRFQFENIVINKFDCAVHLRNIWYGAFSGQCNFLYCRIGVYGDTASEINTVDFNNIVMKPASPTSVNAKYPRYNENLTLTTKTFNVTDLDLSTTESKTYNCGDVVYYKGGFEDSPEVKLLDIAKTRVVYYANSSWNVLSNYPFGFTASTSQATAAVATSDPDATTLYVKINGEKVGYSLTNAVIKTINGIQYRLPQSTDGRFSYNSNDIIEINYDIEELVENTTIYSSKILEASAGNASDVYIPIIEGQDISIKHYTETVDEWVMRKGRVGIDIHQQTASCKFRGLTIEGFDYGLRFNWRSKSSEESRGKSIIDISNCYFEKTRKYDLYFGEGYVGSGSKREMYNCVASICNNRFNSAGANYSGNRCYFQYGTFIFSNNTTPHGAAGVATLEAVSYDGAGGYTTVVYNSSQNWKVESTGSNSVFKSDIYDIKTFGDLGYTNGYLGSGKTSSGNLYKENEYVLENIKRCNTLSIPLTYLKIKHSTGSAGLREFSKNSIGKNSYISTQDGNEVWPIVSSRNENYMLVPSGNNIIKAKVDDTWSIVSQTTKGITIKQFFYYWKNNLEYTGYVQGLFPYEIKATPSTGIVVSTSSNSIVGIGSKYLENSKYVNSNNTNEKLPVKDYIFIDALIVINVPSANYIPRYSCDLVQCGRTYEEIKPPMSNPTLTSSVPITIVIDNLNDSRTKFVNMVVWNKEDYKTYIWTGSEWKDMSTINPWTRYTYSDIGKKSERTPIADYVGQKYYCYSTGIEYTFRFTNNNSTETADAIWIGNIGSVDSLEHPNGYNASTNPVTYATELSTGEMVKYNGKIYSWNGSAFTDINGNLLSNIQVSDKSVLLEAAADSTNNVEVYTNDTPTISIKNPDNTDASSWLTASLNGNILTITATANTSNNPRGGKIILTNTTDEVVINVVQNYV